MKFNKKKVLVVAVCISLVAIMSMGTLAWFTDSDSVTNQFMIADSDDTTADAVFSVTVTEDTSTDGEETADGRDYADVLPGDTLSKVPVVTNTGYYDQYIRVIIDVKNYSKWFELLTSNPAYIGGTTAAQSPDGRNLFIKLFFTGLEADAASGQAAIAPVLSGFDPDIWDPDYTASRVNPDEDIFRYILYYNDMPHDIRGVVESGDAITVFTAVNIPTYMTREQAAAFNANAEAKSLDSSFEISVRAQAIQVENVIDASNDDNVHNAFRAFGALGMTGEGFSEVYDN